MSDDLRPLIRLARRLEQTLERPRGASGDLWSSRWDALLAADRRLRWSRRKGWDTAARLCRRCCESRAAALQQHLEDWLRHVARDIPRPPPSLREIFEDLVALRKEFTDLQVDLRAGTLSVTTDDIRLDGVDLGSFRIVLHGDRLTRSQPYEVLALAPVPADSDSSVTHPHVRNESLCEGDGRAAIRSALEQGRFYDVFVLIRQILETYNSGSAYVPLSEWAGRECHDCGRRTPTEDAAACGRCGDELCLDCSCCCSACGESRCSACVNSCAACEEWICPSCSDLCSDCSDRCCRTCLEDGLCPACRESREREALDPETPEDDSCDEPFPPEAPAMPASLDASTTAVQSLGLGQAAVPA